MKKLIFIIVLLVSPFFVFALIILIRVTTLKVVDINLNKQRHILWIALDGLSSNALKISNNKNFQSLETHSIYSLSSKRSDWSNTGPNFMSIAIGQNISTLDWIIKSKTISNAIFNQVDRAGGSTALFEWNETIERYVGKGKNTFIKCFPKKGFGTIDDKARKTAIEGMKYFMINKPNLEMIYLQNIDFNGHYSNGHGWGSEYFQSIKEDGIIIKNILKRLSTDSELDNNTLVYISSDHGFPRNKNTHAGYQGEDSVNIPLYYWNKKFISKKATPYLSKSYNSKTKLVEWISI